MMNIDVIKHDLEEIRRSGLCVIDPKSLQLFVVRRKRPYTCLDRSNNPKASLKTNKKIPFFVEEYQIPRGKCNGSQESLKNCAIREFIEETGFYFKSLEFLDTFFNLRWYDNGVEWKYTIFIAFASFAPKNMIRVKNVDFMKLKLKFTKNNFEPLIPQIMHLNVYFKKISERLHLYGENNYEFFLNFLINSLKTNKSSTEKFTFPSSYVC